MRYKMFSVYKIIILIILKIMKGKILDRVMIFLKILPNKKNKTSFNNWNYNINKLIIAIMLILLTNRIFKSNKIMKKSNNKWTQIQHIINNLIALILDKIDKLMNKIKKKFNIPNSQNQKTMTSLLLFKIQLNQRKILSLNK